jgi:hypothetical protein
MGCLAGLGQRMRPMARLVYPVLIEVGAGLTAVKDASRRASARWPLAILDRGSARHLGDDQAGTRKRQPAEQGNLPMVEEASLPTVAQLSAKERLRFHLWRRGGPLGPFLYRA